MQLERRVPGQHGEVSIGVKHRHCVSNGGRGNQAVDHPAHRFALLAALPVELGRGREVDGGARKQLSPSEQGS